MHRSACVQTVSRPPCPHLSSTQHSRTCSFLERVSFHSLPDTLVSWLSSNCSSCSFPDSLAGSISFAQPLTSKCAEKSVLTCFPFSVYTHKLAYLVWTCDLKYHVLSRSVVSNSLRPRGLLSPRLLCPQDFSGKNTGVGCCILLQGSFPTQGSNLRLLCLLHFWQITAESSGKPAPFYLATFKVMSYTLTFGSFPLMCLECLENL